MASTTISSVLRDFLRSAKGSRASTLTSRSLERARTYVTQVDVGADRSSSRPVHAKSVLYGYEMEHDSVDEAWRWIRVYGGTGAAALYSQDTLIAARFRRPIDHESLRDITLVLDRGSPGCDLSALGRRHLARLDDEVERYREALVPVIAQGAISLVIYVDAATLLDAVAGPRWACVLERQDGEVEEVEVRAMSRPAAMKAAYALCAARMGDDDVLRSPRPLPHLPASLAVDVVEKHDPLKKRRRSRAR